MFLRCSENKKELFPYLTKVAMQTISYLLLSTSDKDVCCPKTLNMQGLSPCDQEEADTRMFVHVKHAANEYSHIMIKTIDTNVVCIAISCVKHIPELEEIWIEFGSDKALQLPIHEISNALGIPVCEALPFFHSFSSCDTTSSFAGRGKKTF